MMDSQTALISIITRQQDLRSFKEQHWKGSFQEYLEQVWGDAALRFRLMAENTPENTVLPENTPENAG